ASSDFSVRLIRREGVAVVLNGHTNRVYDAVFSRDGQWIATASEDGTARLWHARPRGERGALEGLTRLVPGAGFSADGRRVVNGGLEDVRVWDAESGKLNAVLAGHPGLVKGLSFSPDGRRVVTASFDRSARLWDADSGQQIAVLPGQNALLLGAV